MRPTSQWGRRSRGPPALQAYQDENSSLIVDLAAVFEQGGDAAAVLEANSAALTEATSRSVEAIEG